MKLQKVVLANIVIATGAEKGGEGTKAIASGHLPHASDFLSCHIITGSGNLVALVIIAILSLHRTSSFDHNCYF